MNDGMRVVLREPMAVFVLCGALLYLCAWWLDGQDGRSERSIRVDAADVAQLRGYWEAQAERAPTAAELAALVDERIDEEVLYREALRLGLDRDDVIVRRRLAQKLAFLNAGTANIPAPDEGRLRAWFDRHRARYAVPDVFTLRLLYFSPERHGPAVVDVARAALHEVQDLGVDGAVPPGLGDPFMLPSVQADVGAAQLARDFGSAFPAALRAAPVGRWHGPVESALGVHLVQVVARRGAFAPTYEAVAAQVRDDYTEDARRQAHGAWVRGLRGAYRIEVHGLDAARSAATPQ